MDLKNHNNLLTSGRWYNKDPKDGQILSLVGVAQKLANNSNNPSEIPSRESTKGYPDYIRNLPSWMLEEPKGGVVQKSNDEKEYCKLK